ncbi:tdpoz3 [Trichonephila clavata]|uniref:Tdpoz3 n=1 Tax=Trichonephila clavata TaxID=2740835 RepID=A0A8X6GFD7_TRICU|nr:tdpoz3 [Trichonephila clavata]
MTDEISNEYEFIILWKIENYHCCWQKNEEGLHSSIFTATSMENTKWSLSLYPSDNDKENYIGIYLWREDIEKGPEIITIDYILEILGSDDSVLEERYVAKHAFEKENNSWGLPDIVERTRVLQSEKDRFLPLNTLTVRCRMRRCENKSQERVQMYAKTVIDFEKMSFIWAIDKFSCLKNDQKVPFEMKSTLKEVLMSFGLLLREGQHSDDLIFIDIQCFIKNCKYFLFKVFLMDNTGKKTQRRQREFCYNTRQKNMLNLRFTKTELLEKKSLYLKDDTLSLHCECIFPTGISFQGIISKKIELTLPQTESIYMRSVPKVSISEKQSDDASSLKEDFKALYTEGTLSDIMLSTETKTFPSHSAVLCARSPVFKATLTNDMKEMIKGSVDIMDLDADTVRRMLSYMYTDSVEDLQWESALRLYEAANKYEILSLREKCSDFLENSLSLTNACDALLLADRHHDHDFKMIVQTYIIDRDKCVFSSEEWKMLMIKNSELAAETMHKVWQK